MIFNNFYKNLINKYSYHTHDTGSSEIQILLLNIKIENLKKHVQKNKKDYKSLRGLVGLKEKQKKILNYLKFKNLNNYNFIIKDIFFFNN